MSQYDYDINKDYRSREYPIRYDNQEKKESDNRQSQNNRTNQVYNKYNNQTHNQYSHKDRQYKNHTNHSDLLSNDGRGGYWDSWDEVAQTNARAASIIKKYYQRPAEEFYDLQIDPDEQYNLIGKEKLRNQ